jgi:nicotinic acid phosphoribosyltransferase
MNWYTRITQDLSVIPDFISHYESELFVARSETRIFGNVEKNIANLPGVTEQRFNQLQEIEAVLNYLNIQLRKIRRKHFQKYLEGYNRALTSRDAEKYVDGEQEVIDFEVLINELALLRNCWLGIMKALESKNFMLGHVVRLRTAGMEDIRIE